MRELLPGIFVSEGMVSNAYDIREENGLVLIDAGQPGRTVRIIAELDSAGLSVRDLKQLVSTHAHFDHTGCASDLAGRYGCQVVAHNDEVPYVEQSQRLPLQSRGAEALMWFERWLLPRTRPCHVDVALTDGDLVPESGGYRCVHLPGHTPGSMGLYHAERRVLFCGDALFNRNSITGQCGLRYPLPLVCSDEAQSRDSVLKVSRLAIDSLLCGHGEAVLHKANDAIDRLLVASSWVSLGGEECTCGVLLLGWNSSPMRPSPRRPLTNWRDLPRFLAVSDAGCMEGNECCRFRI